MRSKLVVVLIITASAGLWAADRYQPLDVKTGLWEVTTTVSTSGQMPIPPDLLAKLTPEQRAKFEQQMSGRSLQPAKTDCVQTLFNAGTTRQGRLIRGGSEVLPAHGCVLDEKQSRGTDGLRGK